MDPSPCSPKLASKIPRRRPSTQLNNPSLQPPVSPTKPYTQIATSPPPPPPPFSSDSQPPLAAHNTWPPPALSSQSQSQSQSSNSMIQDRRRTRTRTRTQSTDLSQSTEIPTSPPSHSPSRPPHAPPAPAEDPRRFPPLSIHIPSSSHSPQSQRTRSISNTHSKPSPTTFSPTTTSNSYSFTPRTRQPSLPYSSLRKPPMSERPRVISSSTSNRHERTTTTSTSANLMTPATYESFDFPIPATPDEEREERRLMREWEAKRGRFCGLGRIWTGVREERERVTIIGERTRLLSEEEGKEEVGRWEYVWGEIVCYAKHMLPPVILFVLIALSIALFIYNKEVGRIIRGRFPDQEEEP